jgi:hypothetical protein
LRQDRARAEAKLIKCALLKKIHEKTPLSNIEQRYLRRWVAAIKACKDESEVGATCVPIQTSKLSLRALTPLDRYSLNTIPYVAITPDLDHFGVSDLVLELSHFFDTATVEAVCAGIAILGSRSSGNSSGRST